MSKRTGGRDGERDRRRRDGGLKREVDDNDRGRIQEQRKRTGRTKQSLKGGKYKCSTEERHKEKEKGKTSYFSFEVYF